MFQAFQKLSAPTPRLCRGLRGVFPERGRSLEMFWAEKGKVDAERDALVNIGYTSGQDKKNLLAEIKRRNDILKKVKIDSKLQELTRTGKLEIDYEAQRQEWHQNAYGRHIAGVATHYGVFRSLFGHGYFIPAIPLEVSYPTSEGGDNCHPVHMGNVLMPSECGSVPDVAYPAEPDQLFTLVMTSLDGHLQYCYKEYLHWMVGNIPGNDVSKGQTLCDYMQPFMPKGAGYHRFAFVLYRQEKKVDFEKERRPPKSTSLEARTFKTVDFLRERQDDLTPCGLTFFQSRWEDSLMDFFHKTLDMKVPVFEFEMQKSILKPFVKYPAGKSFNEYIDLYRNEKDMAEEVYAKRLRKLEPFEEEPAPLKYPFAHKVPTDATWIMEETLKERALVGKYRNLKKFSIYPENEPPKYIKTKK